MQDGRCQLNTLAPPHPDPVKKKPEQGGERRPDTVKVAPGQAEACSKSQCPRTSLPGQIALALAMEPVLSNLVTDVSKSYESHIIHMVLAGCQEKPGVCCLATLRLRTFWGPTAHALLH